MRSRLAALTTQHADGLIAAAIFVVVATLATWLPAWQGLERRVFDELTVRTAPNAAKQGIVLVAINEEAMNALKLQWPWPRSLHAELIDRMARGGAAVIALDIVFYEPARDPAEDAALAKSIAKAGNVVLAADFVFDETDMVRVWRRKDPIPALVDAGAFVGAATVPFDPDSILRQFPLDADSFWRQIVKVLQVKAPTLPVPSLPDEGAYIRYLGPDSALPGSGVTPVFDPVPYHLVLEATPEELKSVFDGRVVIVGRDLQATTDIRMAQGDLFATPFLGHSRALTSGMKVHATLVDNALSGAWLRALHPAGNLAIAALVALLSFVGMRNWRPLRSTLVLLALAAAIGAASGYLFANERLWIAIAAPVAIAILIYLAFGIGAFLAEQRRKQEIVRAFSRYLSPEVVKQIAADPTKLELGGVQREITVLFTDLAGFTKLTEKYPPTVVQQILFKHFNAMTKVVYDQKGTLGQFIGDAIMAFWGAPLSDPDHPLRAVQSAIAMQREMEKLRQELRAQGLPEIRMRIGVNTCEAIVGNMGSEINMTYTALGDGVNAGARLEGANKFWGTPILVSGETVAKLRGRIPMRRVDRIRVSGKAVPMDVYTPSEDLPLNARTDAAFDAYLRRDWDTADRIYAELLTANPADGVALRLRERIDEWRRNPAQATPEEGAALEKL